MNKNNRGESTGEAFFILVIIAVSCLFSGLAGCSIGSKEVKVEAVKKGYAEWVVDYNGQSTFTWKCDKQPEKSEAKKEKLP
jgi:hypothetical protein